MAHHKEGAEHEGKKPEHMGGKHHMKHAGHMGKKEHGFGAKLGKHSFGKKSEIAGPHHK